MANARRPSFWFLGWIVLIPLVYSNSLIDPAFTPRAILLGALAIVTIIATWKRPIRTGPLLWIWFVYAAFEVLSIAVAQNSGEAIYGASAALLYGAWLFAAMQMVTADLVRTLLRMIALLGCSIAIIAFFQFFGLGFGFIPGGSYPFATMTTKNMMSSSLFLTVPAGLYLLLADTKGSAAFGMITFTLSTFVLLIAQTRAAWVASAVEALVAALAFVFFGRNRLSWQAYRHKIAAAAFAIGVCLVATFVLNVAPRGPSSTSQKAETLLNYSSDTSANMRLTVWKKSLAMFRDHPLSGVGAWNWKVVLPAYGLAGFPPFVQDGSEQWTEAHNDFLAVLCEAGVGGVIAFLAVFMVAIYLCFRRLRMTETQDEALLAILIGAMICGFAMIAFFDFPMERIEHSMLFLLWLSLIGSRSGSSKAIPITTSKYIRLSVILIAIPVVLLSIQRFRAEPHEKALLQARIDHNWDQEITECNKIYNARLLSLDATATPILYYKAEAEFMKQDYSAALRDNMAALRDDPNHFYTLNNTASCYVKLRNFRAGEVFYKRALAISPNFEESLLNLTAVYYNDHEFDSARATLARCDTTEPGSRAQMMALALRSNPADNSH